MNKKIISVFISIICLITLCFIIIKNNEDEIEKEIKNEVSQLQGELLQIEAINSITFKVKGLEEYEEQVEDFEKCSGIKYNPIWSNKYIVITREDQKAERDKIEAELKKLKDEAKKFCIEDLYKDKLWNWKMKYKSLDENEVLKGFIVVWKKGCESK